MSDLTSTILFEHPLNEKMRTWLRMEFLLQQLESHRSLDNIANALTFFPYRIGFN